jgi:predicted nucleotidyltransferase
VAAKSQIKQKVGRELAVTSSIVRLFPNQALLNVLSVLLINPDRAFYQSELMKRTGDTLLQVQRALHRIEDAGLVSKHTEGNRVYYQAAKQHPAFEDIRQVLLKTTGLCDHLRELVGKHEHSIELAFVYGSIAKGAETAESDVDILIIGDISSRKASGLFRPLSRKIGREINTTIFPRAEYRTKYRKRNRFAKELFESEKIWLIGTNDDLRKMVE